MSQPTEEKKASPNKNNMQGGTARRMSAFDYIRDTICINGTLNPDLVFTRRAYGPGPSASSFVLATKVMGVSYEISLAPSPGKPIGSGAYGVVHIYDVWLNDGYSGQVAVKLMHEPGESQLKNVCRNPCNLIPIMTDVDWQFPLIKDQISETWYMAIMPVASGDLIRFFKENPVPPTQTPNDFLKDMLVIFQAIREQLLCLCTKDQYYLDVKHANILYTSDVDNKDAFYLGDIGSMVPNHDGHLLATFPPLLVDLHSADLISGFVQVKNYGPVLLERMVSYAAGIFLMLLLRIGTTWKLTFAEMELGTVSQYLTDLRAAVDETRDRYGDRAAFYVNGLLRVSALSDTRAFRRLLSSFH